MESKKPKFKSFRMSMIAQSDYGKSYLITQHLLSLLKKKQFTPKRIIIFARLWKTDSSIEPLISFCKSKYPKFEEMNCFERIDTDLIMKLFHAQKQIKEMGKEPKHFLLYLDDQISDSILTAKNSVLLDVFTLMRHVNVSIITCLQSYRSSMNNIMRNQLTVIGIGKLSSQGAIEDILEEFSTGAGDTKKEALQNMRQFWKEAVKSNDNRGFLVVNTTKQYGDGRLQRNFEDFYYDK